MIKKTHLKTTLSLLSAGKIIAVFTDTVPGLAVDNSNDQAIANLYSLKGRDFKKPLVSMVHDLDSAKNLAHIPDWIMPLLKKNWPGALTVIFNSKNQKLTGAKTIGIRIPDHEELLELLKAWKKSLGVTSANESGEKELLSIEEIRQIFGNKIGFYLNSKISGSGQPSTIIDATGQKLRILRQGELKL